MKILTTLFVSLFALSACASDRITATVTVTNKTINGNTLTVNGSVRTFTNNVVTSSTQVATNADVTGGGSKTNLFAQIGLNLFSGVVPVSTGSNSFQLQASCGGALIVTVSGTWASVSYSTQTCAVATPVGVPFGSYYASLVARTNTGSQLVTDLNSYSANSIDQTAPVASQLVGTNNTQTITGTKNFSSTSGIWAGKTTNGVNVGTAFSSLGTGDGSEQFGNGANASGENSEVFGADSTASGFGALAVGTSARAAGEASIAIGAECVVSNASSVALGSSVLVSGDNAVAIGVGTIVSGANGTAIGEGSHTTAANATSLGANAQATYSFSTAIGASSTTTASNQVMLGAPGINTVVQNDLTVQTNATVGGGFRVFGLQTNLNVTGTNNFPAGADIAFSRFPVSSLANGNNAAVPIGTNVFIEVSGPSGAFSINGIANGRDGKMIVLLNQSGQLMTIANESGIDPVAANRIRTLTGADLATAANSTCTLIYSGNASRWILLSAGTVTTVTNVNASQITGSITANQIYTPITQTNFVLNQLYTNLTGGGIAVHALASLTTAAVSGSSEMDLMVAQTGSTFSMIDGPKLITSISAVTGAMQFGINGSVQTNGIYYFTNSSSGAGDSSSIVSGSGQVTGL